MKVLFTGNFKEKVIEKIKNLGFDVDLATSKMVKEGDYSRDAEILCGSILLEKMDLREFKNLKIILTYSIGVDYLDHEYLRERGITLCNNKGAYAEPIGEWIIYDLMVIDKFGRQNIERQRNKIWKRRAVTYNLYNKKILFLGTGDIAKEAAKRLANFKMEIIGFNTRGKETDYFDRCVSLENLEETLAEADYVVMVLPLTKSTYKFMDKEKFYAMKEGAVFINVGRGETVDEKALIEALNNKLRGAALDVFEREPLLTDSPLWEMDNVYISPHIADLSEDSEERVLLNVMENLKRINSGKELINVVDFKKGY
ncbi:D-isomer specific 2-hydroxyacid dehydrogenase [Peptoniphilus sp. ING2-D1G]|nr:D-isomer specific 2-hydroxyacid dehydrogenase [Peptoniphilus sp. ING2-D1G]